MDREKQLPLMLSVLAVIVFASSYGVGFYIGKKAGIEEEREKCEMEKRQLAKQLSTISPVSRPQPAPVFTPPPPPPKPKEEVKPETAQTQVEQAEREKKPAPPLKEEVKKSAEEAKAQAVRKADEAVEATKQKVEQREQQRERERVRERKEIYYLQAGVFRNRENALKRVNRLKALGFNAKVESRGVYTKVLVGPYYSLEEARKAEKELLKYGIEAILKRRKA